MLHELMSPKEIASEMIGKLSKAFPNAQFKSVVEPVGIPRVELTSPTTSGILSARLLYFLTDNPCYSAVIEYTPGNKSLDRFSATGVHYSDPAKALENAVSTLTAFVRQSYETYLWDVRFIAKRTEESYDR